MDLCLPLIFSIIGTLLVIASVVTTGFLISKKEQNISLLEIEVKNANKIISGAHEAIQRSYQHFSSSEIRLLIIQASTNKTNYDPALQEIFKGFIQGLLERYSAANGEGPSNELFKKWELLAMQSKTGNVEAMSELSKISNSLLSEWADRHRKIVNERGNSEIEIEELKRKVAAYRNMSVTLQIIGLIMVLFKDVFTT